MSTRAQLFSRETRPGLLLSAATFMLIGLGNTLYGPAFERFALRHQIGLDSVGLLVSAQFGGALLAIASSGLLLECFGYRRLIVAGAGLVVVGALTVAHAPSWPLTLAAAGVHGAGTGLLVASVNLLTTRLFENAATPALNLMNAVYGIGAIAGPLVVALSTPRLEPPFYLLAVAGLAVVVGATRVSLPAVRRPPVTARTAPVGLVLMFALVLFFYIGTEVGITSWETEHLSERFGAARAAAFTSLFWVATTLGRLLAVPLSTRVAPGPLVVGALGLGIASLLAAQVLPLAPVFYALAGLSIAPVFATTVAWFTAVLGDRSERYAPLMLAGGNLGPVTTAPIIGGVVAAVGSGAIPLMLAALATCGLLAAVTLLVSLGRRA